MSGGNYSEFLQNNDSTLPVRWRGEIERHQCPVCGNWTAASLIADVTGISVELTGGRWACDACWSEWQRQQFPLSPSDNFVTAEEWFCRFCELTGREAGNRDAFLGRQYALEADRLRGLLSSLSPTSADAVAAQARLDVVLARSTFPGVWGKLDITADGIDAATLSGVPHGTEIECDGVVYVIEDGDFSLATSTPGAFTVTARHPRFIWQEWTIHAS
jgi:hypothetical protein